MITTDIEFGGYADSIITDPADFDRLEVHGVAEESDGNGGTICEINDGAPEFYSVYAQLKQVGVECIGDFRTRDNAVRYAYLIAASYGWEVSSFC